MPRYDIKNSCLSEAFSPNANVCILCARNSRTWRRFFDHLAGKHALKLFFCPPCSVAFLSAQALKRHLAECQPLPNYSAINAALDVDLNPLAHLLVCSDCGFFVAVGAQETSKQRRNYESFWNHCPRRIFQITVYCMAEYIRTFCSASKPLRDSLTFTLSFVSCFNQIPLNCDVCQLRFKDAAEIEQHTKKQHSSRTGGVTRGLLCSECGISFCSYFSLRMHESQCHTSAQADLLEFLMTYAPQAPLNSSKRASTGNVFCDLCAMQFPLQRFNTHDCAVNYTRRYQIDGKIIKCPCVQLKDLRIDTTTETGSSLMPSLSQTLVKLLELSLHFNRKSRITSKLKPQDANVWFCRFCKAIFEQNNIEANMIHLERVHKVELPPAWTSDRETIAATLLAVYSSKIQKGDSSSAEGLVCPVIDCGRNRFCSIEALKIHVQMRHAAEEVHDAPEWPSKEALEKIQSMKQVGEKERGLVSVVPSLKLRLKRDRGPNEGGKLATQSSHIKEKSGKQRKSSRTNPSLSGCIGTTNTLLLHPPPVPGMQAGLYNFFATYYQSKNNNRAGLLVKCDDSSVMYTVLSASHVASMTAVSQSGRTNFAIGCIPENFKLPANVNVPELAQNVAENDASITQGKIADKAAAQPLSDGTSSLPSELFHYECPVCGLSSEGPASLQSHLEKVHLRPCQNCSACFVTDEFRQRHEEEGCSEKAKQSNDIIYFCAKCQQAFKDVCGYYSHLLNSHQSLVNFDENSGQVFPNCNSIFREASEKISLISADDHVTRKEPLEGALSSVETVKRNEKGGDSVLDEAVSRKRILARDDESSVIPKKSKSCDMGDKTVINTSVSKELPDGAANLSADVNSKNSEQHTPQQSDIISPRARNSAGEETEKTNLPDEQNERRFEQTKSAVGQAVDTQSIESNENLTVNDMEEAQASVIQTNQSFLPGQNAVALSSGCELQNERAKGDLTAKQIAKEIDIPVNSATMGRRDVEVEEVAKEGKSDGRKSGRKDEPHITIIDDDIQIVFNEDDGDADHSSKQSKELLSCSICSRVFKTARAVQEHMHTHAFDAGATCEQSFGVATGVDVHVCRVCCLAYERRDVYESHSSRHGVVHTCARCTAVSFDKQQMSAHQQSHIDAKVVFGCVDCRIAYRQEQNLLLHRNAKHAMRLLWLCMKCGRANTDYKRISEHVVSAHKKPMCTVASMLMPCPLVKMHYQPADPIQHEAMIAKLPEPMKLLNTPAECPHRTFLSYSETLVCCPRCGSMIPATKYLLEHENLRKLGQFKLLLVDFNTEFAEQQALHPTTTNFPSSVSASGSAPKSSSGFNAYSHTSTTSLSSSVPLAIGATRPTLATITSTSISTPLPSSQVSSSSLMSTVVSSTSSMATSLLHQQASTSGVIRLPLTVSAAPLVTSSTTVHVQPVPSLIRQILNNKLLQPPSNLAPPMTAATAAPVKPLATVAPNSSQLNLPLIPHQTLAASRSDLSVMLQQPRPQLHQQQQQQEQFTSSLQNVCSTCNTSFTTQAALKVHTMKHDAKNVMFCLECGFRTQFYHAFYEHMFQEHGQRLNGPVNCVCDNCGQSLPSLQAYAQHAHPGVARCNVCKSMVCGGDEELRAHRLRHATLGDFWCVFCGACFAFKRHLDRHLIKHACDTWVMCRECGMCYKQMDQVVTHFTATHYKQLGQLASSSAPTTATLQCISCNQNVGGEGASPQQHVIIKHVVYAARLKATLSLDHRAYRLNLKASTRFMYDKTVYKEAFACFMCLHVSFNKFACRNHMLNRHLLPVASPSSKCAVWPFLAPLSALVMGPNTACCCAVCDEQEPSFKRLVHHMQTSHQPAQMCLACDDVLYDDVYDAEYHCHFSHGASWPTAVPSGNLPLTSCRFNLSRNPSFSTLYCLLCGTCLADQSFVTHISSHRLSASANGYATLDLCPVCGVCLVNKNEEALRSHATSHGASGAFNDALVALSRADQRFMRCYCSGVILKTPPPATLNESQQELLITANCSEPPHCSLCDEILSWNGTSVVEHFIQNHSSNPNTNPALIAYHAEHSAGVSRCQLFCRMCNFLASWPCC